MTYVENKRHRHSISRFVPFRCKSEPFKGRQLNPVNGPSNLCISGGNNTFDILPRISCSGISSKREWIGVEIYETYNDLHPLIYLPYGFAAMILTSLISVSSPRASQVVVPPVPAPAIAVVIFPLICVMMFVLCRAYTMSGCCLHILVNIVTWG